MKHTEGKQKIEMKSVEDYKARMITFLKRKAEIIKKMTEIIIAQCDEEVNFLAFTQAGKAHQFTHLSMEDVVNRVRSFVGLEPSGKDDTNVGSLVDANKRQKEEERKKQFADLVEELEMVQEEEKNFKESQSGWCNIPNEGLSMEDIKQKHQKLAELRGKLEAYLKTIT
ncbi:unnamed protein product [Eruca vesicaria subsp. sativa]|uniref:MADS-box domain-containing protein n=1 Tax=Eruca vesicaria subsp. sativa TaxID=29727 RepID=A0ABC8L623_ERUVS|nr:unnamed protein product [Eruca vesicaria subsp. sativa]